MDFSDVLRKLKGAAHGTRRFARAGWNGKDMWITIQYPEAHSKMTLPYLYMRTVQGDLVPWLISQTDALAEDWIEIEE
jgi:hypothetical protein